MDAGVPIKAPVAGISCGLITDGGQETTFTDIQGVEDFYGDMDFKVAGTKKGITAIQVDIKVDGLTPNIIKQAFEKCRVARYGILDEIMLKAIPQPREDVSDWAPKMTTMHINPDKIREVIGKGGSVIQNIVAESGAKVDIEDDGTVTIAAVKATDADKAKKMIEAIVKEPEPGEIYYGKVVRLMNFGAFVNLLPGKDGMVHISKMADHRIEKVEDAVKEGDMVWVKVMEIDDKGRVNLSMKDVKPEEKPVEQPTVPVTKVEQPAEEAPAADEVKKENITVCIEWEDEDNVLGLRPTTIAVTLSGSDGQTYSAKIAEKDGWQHTFADLTTRRGAEVIYYSVDADDVTDYDKDVRGLTVTYTCTAKPVVDEQPAADDENLIDDQMDGDPAELPDGDGPTVTETEDGTVIDMGETAEAPVEGEEANAEKPEEDGELDEDFILPEEGELPEEDAEPEIPEIDFSTLQVVIGEPQYDGDVMTLRATLIGFDNIDYALQWQFSTDDATWTDVSGATGDTLVVQLDESNAGCYWRVSAEIFGWKTLPTEQAA